MAPSSSSSPFARWRYVYATQQWELSPEALRLFDVHDAVADDLAALFDRVPDVEERETLRELLEEAVASRTSMAAQVRLRTDSRGEAVFAIVADTALDERGEPVELRGYSTDVTVEVRQATRAAVDAATRHRRAIEQVKGALMVTYRLDEVTAFALVRRQSNQHNVKLNVLAEQVAQAMASGPRGGAVPMMELIDGVARRLSSGRDEIPDALGDSESVAT